MPALLLALLLASPALDEARASLGKGKLDAVLFALLPNDAVPDAEAKQASALLVDAAKLAVARNDKALALQLAQMAARRDAKSGAALKLLGEFSLRDTELRLAVKYGQQWVEAEPQSEEAKRFLARAEERERTWTPPPPKKKARSWKAALTELRQRPAVDGRRMKTVPIARADRRVILYGTTWCKACNKARSWLARSGVAFENKDLERDSVAARELEQKRLKQRLHGRGIPVIDVNGLLIEGFRPRAIEAALARSPG